MGLTFRTGAPLFAYDDDLRIVSWNEGAEKLTGVPADEAIGAPCWAVLRGVDDAGHVVCHQGCGRSRLVHQGCPLPAQVMSIRTGDSRRRIAIESVAANDDDERVYLHLMREAPEPVVEEKPAGDDLGPAPRLTPRQLEILGLIAQGVVAREIARRLYLTETTVRNHIRALLVELQAHSQLEAVYVARRHGLV